MQHMDRRQLFSFLGGSAAVAAMTPEARADALERYLAADLEPGAGSSNVGAARAPTVAELEAQITTRNSRRGLGNGMVTKEGGGNVASLPPLPAKPMLTDMIRLRLQSNAEYRWVRKHRWYMAPRLVTVNDLYSSEPVVKVTIDEFEDVIRRHFRQPRQGLGHDGSAVAHMWRPIANPDAPL